MAVVTSRARIRQALATLCAGVSGIAAVYGYEPDMDTPALQQATYVIVELLDYSERLLGGGGSAPISEQQRTALLHLVQQSDPADPHDNSVREALQTSIDTVRDALEAALRATRRLSDGTGAVAFDMHIQGGVDAAFSFATDRTVVDSWIKVLLRVQQ